MPVQFKDYYQILGVPRDASEADIKRAFRQLARRHHPDLAKDKAAGEERFKEINEAYDVLGDPAKRARYDQLGTDWSSGAAGRATGGDTAEPGESWSEVRSARPGGRFRFGGTGFSDFFERFFGVGTGFEEASPDAGHDRTGRGSRRHGQDTEADLLVTLDDAIRGTERLIQVERIDPNTGTSQVQTVNVRVPAGVREGQRLRVAGLGDRGSAGAPAGDLYLRVRLAAHPDFRVRGDDLFFDLTLAPWEAALGAAIDVPLPGGRQARIRVPPGTSSGRQLRLRGRGLPTAGDAAGDLYVVVTIAVPQRLTSEEREHWERLARVSRFAPREPAR